MEGLLADFSLLSEVPTIIQSKKLNYTRLFIVVLVSGVAGALFDHIHVKSRTTIYTNPTLFGQAWYMIFVFGFGIAGAYLNATPFARRVYAIPPSKTETIENIASLIVCYFVSAVFHYNRTLDAVILWSAFAARALLVRSMDNKRTFLVFASLVGIGGSLFEAILSATGAFYYNGSDFIGIPLWLPALYCNAAFSGLAIARHYPVY
jgi:hypothetical protein